MFLSSNAATEPDRYDYNNGERIYAACRRWLVILAVLPPLLSLFMILTGQDRWFGPLGLYMLIPPFALFMFQAKGMINRAVLVYPDRIVEIGPKGNVVAEISNDHLREEVAVASPNALFTIGPRSIRILSSEDERSVHFAPGIDRYAELIELVQSRIDAEKAVCGHQ